MKTENKNALRSLMIWVAMLLVLCLLSGCSIFTRQLEPFAYKVRVEDGNTKNDILNADITLELKGEVLRQTTDSRGSVVFSVGRAHQKQTGRLVVEAAGYEKYNLNVTLDESPSPQTVSLRRVTPEATSVVKFSDTPTAVPTNMPRVIPTMVPTSTPRVVSTATPTPDTKTITCLITAFGSYYPALQIVVDGLDRQNGFKLSIVPLTLPKPDGTILNEYDNDELYRKIRTGEADCVLTTLDVFGRYGDFGVITAIVDESAGADQIWARKSITTVNDLLGKTIAYEEGSASEFLLYSALYYLVGGSAKDVKLIPASLPNAIQSFNAGKVDAVSGWEPDIIDAREGGHQLVTTDKFRPIVDVIVFSRQAIATKSDSVKAFHRAWFQALKVQFDNPARAAQSIAAWGETEWTTIHRGTAQSDLESLLQHVAQAGFGANVIIMDDDDMVKQRLRHAQTIWALSGVSLPPLDVNTVVDPRFVRALRNDQTLIASKPPINSIVLMAEQPRYSALTGAERTVAILPCKEFG